MIRDPSKLLEEALRLPPEARAALAGLLIESLDEGADEHSEEAWSRELRRRMAEIDAKTVTSVSWSEARDKILMG